MNMTRKDFLKLSAVGAGAAVGAVNGYLIGYLRTRPFLTTLVTLIVLRATVDLLGQQYSVPLAMASRARWMPAPIRPTSSFPLAGVIRCSPRAAAATAPCPARKSPAPARPA